MNYNTDPSDSVIVHCGYNTSRTTKRPADTTTATQARVLVYYIQITGDLTSQWLLTFGYIF
jgi:hypothetical protein